MSVPAWAAPLLALVERLDPLLPPAYPSIDWAHTQAAHWHPFSAQHGGLEALATPRPVSFDSLLAMDSQKRSFRANAEQFLNGWPSNHCLLWGARGTGKSTLVRALLTQYADQGLRLIEVDKDHLHQLPRIVRSLADQPYHFVVFCDDLSFEAGDSGYQALKSILEGSLAQMPQNLMVIATSNRRHIVPEFESDNARQGAELHQADSIEERIALSDRFGLSLSFYQYTPQQYLDICRAIYVRQSQTLPMQLPEFDERMAIEANRFATARGGRGGRIAEQFVRDWLGRWLMDRQG